MTVMLPESCDPGYGERGIQVGVSTLRQQAELFGSIRSRPSTCRATPSSQWAVSSNRHCRLFPTTRQALQAYSAIGQETVQDSALQNAMVASAIANGGALMTPHLMSSIQNSQGSQVKTYAPTLYKQVASASTAQSVTALMEGVITNPSGTAAGVGSLRTCVPL